MADTAQPAEPAPKLSPAEKRKKKRQEAAAAGKCSQCTVRDPRPGLKTCAHCAELLAKAAKTSAKKRRDAKKAAKTAAPIATKPTEPAAPVTVASVFEPFAAQLKAIDWRDPVKREAEVGAILGQMLVAVVVAPQLSDADREKLQWLQSLSRQMVTFRDASAIEAARRRLSGEDEKPAEDVDGPQMEPDPIEVVVADESVDSEADRGGAAKEFRGRPRARAFS